MPTEARTTRSARRRPAPAVAFTLTELLIVMAVIVLALTLAVPAIKALTGNKSEQAAQNILSAYLGQARTEAIGLQTVRGVMFYINPANGRVTCVQVTDAGNQGGQADVTSAPNPIYLDLAPNHDPMVLPPGLRLFTFKDSAPPPAAFPRPFTSDRYLGFNTQYYTDLTGAATPPPNATRIGGVILFDGEGRTISRPYGFHVMTVTATGPQLSDMGRLMGFTVQTMPRTDWPPPNGNPRETLKSQLAFAIVDFEALTSAQGAGADGNNSTPSQQQQKENWVDQNATPIFVNRYNGTLVRAE